jgi:hypothetical protein
MASTFFMPAIATRQVFQVCFCKEKTGTRIESDRRADPRHLDGISRTFRDRGRHHMRSGDGNAG